MLRHSTWQPIETAPRDGTAVLFVSLAGDYSVGRWDGDEWDMQSAPPRKPFTHWLPLPAPPTG